MKLVKKVVCAVLFVSALSVSAYAGDMETPGYVPPPPARSMSQPASTTDTADTSCLSTEPCEEVSDTSDELIYNALMALMSLL